MRIPVPVASQNDLVLQGSASLSASLPRLRSYRCSPAATRIAGDRPKAHGNRTGWNAEFNDVRFGEAAQGPCFPDLGRLRCHSRVSSSALKALVASAYIMNRYLSSVARMIFGCATKVSLVCNRREPISFFNGRTRLRHLLAQHAEF